jgi:hypothetical protein
MLALCAALAATALLPAAASASELIDRDASGVKLQVNDKGQAMLTYRARGKLWHVLAWNAVDARPSTPSRAQVRFRLDYAGGWGTYRKKSWIGFPNTCGPYTGPALAWMLTACTAADGSHWAIQKWQRMLANYGLNPTPAQAVWELRLSHWTTELPTLEVNLNWAYRRFDHLFGRFTYLGSPVYGFRATPAGVPLDTYGRNLYLDTYNSTYGPGWKRENSFLMHTGSGAFCYGLFAHGAHPVGKGDRYRATIIGPGVTPDIHWESAAPGPYDRATDLQFNEMIKTLGSAQCKPN